MMLAAVPPSVITPWTRASGRSCWRHSPTELNSRIIASSAFRPSQGSEAAWAWQAVERDLDVLAGEQAAGHVGHVRGVEEERRVEAVEQAVVDHQLLARAALLGRRAEEDDLAGQLRRRSPRGRSPHRRPRRPSCCGRSHDRGQATRRTRRGSRSAARRRPARGPSPGPSSGSGPLPCRHAAGRGPRWPGCRPDARPRNRGRESHRRSRSRPGPPRRPSSGLAWIRWLRSRISARFASTAAARRALAGPNGPAGSVEARAQDWRRLATLGAHRSTDRVASATPTITRTNRAIGRLNAFSRRSRTNRATAKAIQPPRRKARVQSPR